MAGQAGREGAAMRDQALDCCVANLLNTWKYVYTTRAIERIVQHMGGAISAPREEERVMQHWMVMTKRLQVIVLAKDMEDAQEKAIQHWESLGTPFGDIVRINALTKVPLED